MSRTFEISVLITAALLAAMVAAPAFAQNGEAQVRVAHLAPDAPNVDVYVNDEPVAALQNVPYTTVSSYLSLPAGTQQVTVYAAGDTSTPVIEAPVELAAGGAYTIAAVGLVADESLTAQVYEDDLRSPSAGSAKLRVVHASPDVGPVDVIPRGGAPLVEGLAFPDTSPYAEVPAGSYTLDVNAAGTNQTALTVPGAALADGAVYSAFAIGTVYADSLDVLLVQDNASSASASAPASASASASAGSLPHTGGVAWPALPAALALTVGGLVALGLVRRRI